MTTPGRPQSFTAIIQKLGINPYVEVPEEASAALGGRGNIPVAGTLNGQPIRATLVPRGNRYILYLNTAMRKAARVSVEDTVTIVLTLDREPREIAVPPDVAEAVHAAGYDELFSSVIPSRRKEWLVYLLDAKTPATRAKRVRQIIAALDREAERRSEKPLPKAQPDRD